MISWSHIKYSSSCNGERGKGQQARSTHELAPCSKQQRRRPTPAPYCTSNRARASSTLPVLILSRMLSRISSDIRISDCALPISALDRVKTRWWGVYVVYMKLSGVPCQAIAPFIPSGTSICVQAALMRWWRSRRRRAAALITSVPARAFLVRTAVCSCSFPA